METGVKAGGGEEGAESGERVRSGGSGGGRAEGRAREGG